MRTRFLTLILAVALAAACATPAVAGEIEGRVFYENSPSDDPLLYLTYQEGQDSPAEGRAVFIERMNPMPGQEFQDIRFTGPDGAYAFHDLPDDGIYQIELVFTDPVESWLVVEQTDDGPRPIPPAPDGVVPGSGRPTRVDIPLLPSVAPAFIFGEPPPDNIVIAGVFLESNLIPAAGGGLGGRNSGVVEGGQSLVDGLDLVITPVDPPGSPITVVSGTTYSFPDPTGPYAGFDGESWGGCAIFFGHPLQPGDIVDVSIDMGQPGTGDYGAVSATTVRLVYDPASPPDIIEFRLRPVLDLTGRAFVEPGPVNGVFDGSDYGVPGYPISLWDLNDLAAPAVATATSGSDGTFTFPSIFYGIYRVQIDETSPGPALVRMVFEDDPDPAEFAFTPDTAPDATSPDVICPTGPILVEATSAAGAVVTFEVTATDTVDLDPVIVCTPASGSTFPIGTTTVSCTATDRSGNVGTCSFDVTVRDTTAPEVSVRVLRTLLWPPRMGLLPVGLTTTVMDAADPAPRVSYEIYSNEPSGRFTPDTYGSGAGLRLRAERDFLGTGRFYLIVARVEDAAGNASHACATVSVPTSPTASGLAMVAGLAAQARSACEQDGMPPLTLHALAGAVPR